MDRAKTAYELHGAGFTEMQSESLSFLLSELATKGDIGSVRSDMDLLRSEMKVLRSEMQTMEARFQAAIADSGKRSMEAIAALQNKLFTHRLALIGAMTAIFTLISFVMR